MTRRALAQLAGGANSQLAESTSLEPRAIRHEVAHLLFLNGVWPSTRGRSTRYGGDAPDWLDEAAAVAAESEGLTDARRAAFRKAARASQLIPLGQVSVMVTVNMVPESNSIELEFHRFTITHSEKKA